MPEKSLGQRSLAGSSPWGRIEFDMVEATALTHTLFIPITLLEKIDQDEPWFLRR